MTDTKLQTAVENAVTKINSRVDELQSALKVIHLGVELRDDVVDGGLELGVGHGGSP